MSAPRLPADIQIDLEDIQNRTLQEYESYGNDRSMERVHELFNQVVSKYIENQYNVYSMFSRGCSCF